MEQASPSALIVQPRTALRRIRLRIAVLSCALALLGLTGWPSAQAEGQVVRATRQNPPPAQPGHNILAVQQAVWHQKVDSLAPQRPGLIDVYGLVFSPFADGDVFLRESSMVAALLAERFDARGRVVHLANHPTTVSTHPWATPLNLERAVDAMAARMDRDHDLLVVYLTSHGARDFRLAAANGAMPAEPLSPVDLRRILDKSGIRNRVLIVSACYSGGWVAPLAGNATLVMTAADADHSSYGCGKRSELTFFGRAVFHEQLRTTRSFEKAFAQAVPLIREREIAAGKSDGFSNPQISVGDKIRPVLQSLEQRLEGAGEPGG